MDRRERLRRLALETIDLAKDPYYMRNHLGQIECKLCLTLHPNEGNYLAHTQVRRALGWQGHCGVGGAERAHAPCAAWACRREARRSRGQGHERLCACAVGDSLAVAWGWRCCAEPSRVTHRDAPLPCPRA